MRLSLDARAARLLRSLPRTSPYGLIELLLLLLLAWQIARLAWVIVTPVGPLGDWRGEAAMLPAPPAGIAGTFDPFFRLGGGGGGGPVVVTELNLTLFGTRADQASGRGSAIVGLPDGRQQSFAVGDEILPGVTLAAVSFDGITIRRGGASEQLFLDQSVPAPVSAPASAPPAPGTDGAVSAAALTGELRVTPRVADGEVTGLALAPGGSGAAFRAAGLQPGDVLLAVNGERIRSAADGARMAALIGQTPEAVLEVERGGAVSQLRVRIAR